MRTILLFTLVLLLAPAVAAQKKKVKTYEDQYAAFYAKHCATPEPRLEECTDDPSAHGCRKIVARKLNCDTAKILAEPIHFPTAEEWLKAYSGLTYWWESYDSYPFYYPSASGYYGSCRIRR